ncbi:hypothetical protein [Thermogladius sp.]|uniref:hypothetical protein n=1 Tax=Thermogladius sp. TaxID=2023064 RepID=UPI003D12D6CD
MNEAEALIIMISLAGWVIAMGAIVYLFGVLGRRELAVASLLADCRKKRALCALLRVGRSLRLVKLTPVTEEFFYFSMGGLKGLVKIVPNAIYRIADADVVVATLANPRSLTPEELDRLGWVTGREDEIVYTVKSNIKTVVLPRLRDEKRRLEGLVKAYQAYPDENSKAKLSELQESLNALNDVIREVENARLQTLEDVATFIAKMRQYGLDVKAFLPVALAGDLDALDRIAEQTALGATSLLTAAASVTKGLEEMFKRFEKAEKKSNILVLFLVLLMSVVGFILLTGLMHR